MSKRNSRKISVDGNDYRWAFFENSGWNDLTVQSASGSGRKLSVSFPWDQTGIAKMPYASITPSIVSEAIVYALKNGWDPEENGPPFTCRSRNGVMELS